MKNNNNIGLNIFILIFALFSVFSFFYEPLNEDELRLSRNKVEYELEETIERRDYLNSEAIKLTTRTEEQIAEIEARREIFQETYERFKDRVEKGLMTRFEQAQIQQQLSREESNLSIYKSRIEERFEHEVKVYNDEILELNARISFYRLLLGQDN